MVRGEVVRHYGGVSADARREERRHRLIEVGRDIWGRSGPGEVTVRGVCKESGLVYRYFYEHFADRNALILAIADQVRDELVAVLVEAGGTTVGGVELRLRAALVRIFTVLDADPRMFRIMTADSSGIAGLEDRRRKTLDLIAETMVAHVTELSEAPATDHAAMFVAARFIVGGVNRLVEAWLVERDRSVVDVADRCTRLSMAVVRAAR